MGHRCNAHLLLRAPSLKRWLATAFYPVVIGSFAATATVVIQFLVNDSHMLELGVVLDASAFPPFTLLVAFFAVFQTSQADAKLAECASAIHSIRGVFFLLVSDLISRTRHSTADDVLVEAFKQKVVRFASLLSSLILDELEGILGKTHCSRGELIDTAGLDKHSLKFLEQSDQKCSVVFQWLQNEIVDNISNGVLVVPGPLLARSFPELYSVMAHFHSALKIASTPLPFPSVVCVQLLLFFHCLVTPFLLSAWTSSYFLAATVAFFVVSVLWAVHLQNPFESDANLDMRESQVMLNRFLVSMMSDEANRSVALAVEPGEAAARVRFQFPVSLKSRVSLSPNPPSAGGSTSPDAEDGERSHDESLKGEHGEADTWVSISETSDERVARSVAAETARQVLAEQGSSTEDLTSQSSDPLPRSLQTAHDIRALHGCSKRAHPHVMWKDVCLEDHDVTNSLSLTSARIRGPPANLSRGTWNI